MNFQAEQFSLFWALAGAVLCVPILGQALRRAPWWHLRNPQDLNVLLLTILGVLFIWTQQAGLGNALTLHLLGATLLTLMFGPWFAVLALSLIMLALALFQDASLLALPWQILLLGVLPVSVSYAVFRLSDRRLPNNYFVYVFVCAFFGAALALAVSMGSSTLVHYLSGVYPPDYLVHNFLQYTLLLIFPEAFLTGMLMAIFVAFRPQWVSTFDDRRYLHSHDQQPR